MEIPRLGVESELQLLAYTTATTMPDPSHICSLHHSSGQCRILNPLSEARDQTCILVDTSWVCLELSHHGDSEISSLIIISAGKMVRMSPLLGFLTHRSRGPR